MDNYAKITEYIFLPSRYRQTDLIFIFGTRHTEKIVAKVKSLYSKGLTNYVLVTGGINKITGENEAECLAKALTRAKIPKSKILIENKSTNSLENVLYAKEILIKNKLLHQIKSITVISKNYHIRRALMTLKKHFPKGIEFYLNSISVFNINKNNWLKSELGKKYVLGEYTKIQEYLAKGDLEEL